jgi:light-regulated signal transduction histidine kinase (bacteriophytochrome)
MVTAFCGRLSSDYQDKFDKRGKEYMSLVVNSARHMTQLLDDVVDFGRLDSSDGRENWFEAGELLDRAEASLAEAISISGAEISRGDLPRVYCNPIRFQRLLENIVGNALKYVADDVRPRVRVAAAQNGDFWRFSVSDNGIGIEARHFARIFEPFRRLHDKSRYGGTGLGLAISRKIVEGFGGEICVSSKVGEGSTFSFTVKIRGEQRNAAE